MKNNDFVLTEKTESDILINRKKGKGELNMNVDKDTCIGCGACAGVCPVEALAFDDEGKMECDKDTCIGCQACVGTCPVEAISAE